MAQGWFFLLLFCCLAQATSWSWHSWADTARWSLRSCGWTFPQSAEFSRNTIWTKVPVIPVSSIPFSSIGKHGIGAGTIALSSAELLSESTIKYHLWRQLVLEIDQSQTVLFLWHRWWIVEDSSLASTRFKGSCARSNMVSMWVTRRCRELSWTFTTKNWSISIFDQESTLPALWRHTHTQDANLPLRCHYAMDVFSCYVKKDQALLANAFPTSLRIFEPWHEQSCEAKYIVGSRWFLVRCCPQNICQLAEKYTITGKYHWKAQSRCHGGGCRCWWRSDDWNWLEKKVVCY